MSPLLLKSLLPRWLRPRVVMHMHPHYIRWVRRGLRMQELGRGELLLENNAKDMTRLLATLPQVMQEAVVAGAVVELVLASSLMRYALVPNPDGAANSEELDMLCRYAFERVHGDAVAQWDIRLSLAGLGGNGIASAMDRTLLHALMQEIKAAGGLLVSVQPELAYAFNQVAPTGVEGVFALRERDRLSLIAWQQRAWVAVQQYPVLADWQRGLDAMLGRLHLQTHLSESTPVHVYELLSGDMEPRTVAWQAPVSWTISGLKT